MDDLRLGRLTLQTRDQDQERVVDRLGRRIFAGLVVSAFVLAGSSLLGRGASYQVVGIVLIAFGVAWLLWHLLLDLRR